MINKNVFWGKKKKIGSNEFAQKYKKIRDLYTKSKSRCNESKANISFAIPLYKPDLE